MVARVYGSRPRVNKLVLFYTILNDKDGKDKTVKLVQYTSRLLIWIGTRKALRPSFYDTTEVEKLLSQVVSNFSMFRKIIRLGNWLEPSKSVTDMIYSSIIGKQHSEGFHYEALETGFLDLFDLWNAIFDDVYCLAKMGLIKSKALANYADVQANRAWMAAILINLRREYTKLIKRKMRWSHLKHTNQKSESKEPADIEKLRKQLTDEDFWGFLSILKLLCDFAFCSIDVFDLRLNSVFQTTTGLISGIIGYCKVYSKFNIAMEAKLA